MATDVLDTAYFAAYADQNERDLYPKKAWTDASLERSIVPAALRFLAYRFGVTSDLNASIRDSGNGVFHLGEPLIWHGIRVQLLGLASTDGRAADALVSELRDHSREALCICILPSVESFATHPPDSDPAWPASATLFVFPDDIDALARNHWNLEEMLEFKFSRIHFFEKPTTESQFDPRLAGEFRAQYRSQPALFIPVAEVLAAHSDDPRSWARHPSLERIQRALQGGRSCLLIGPSSSGKTVLALEAAQKCIADGTAVKYINLGTISGTAPYCLTTLLAGSLTSHRSVYVVDDLQSHPQASQYLAQIANLCRRAAVRTPLLLIAISWPDFADQASQFIEDCLPLYVRAKDVRQSVIAAYSRSGELQAESHVAEAIKDDLQLLRLYLDVQREADLDAPSLQELAESYWGRRLAGSRVGVGESKRAVLTVATLGRYDVFVSRDFVETEAQVPPSAIDALQKNGMLRVSRKLLTVGHRSLAALIADWLAGQKTWDDFRKKNGPEDPFALVKDYLRLANPELALETLRALQARAGFKESTKLNSRTAALVAIWKAFNSLLERIRHQQGLDAHWGRAISSIMFAVQALAETGRLDDARSSMAFVRSKYTVDDNALLRIDISGLSTAKDFELIAEAMRKQDEELGALPPRWERATDVDIDRFHSTWLSGVILCTEASYVGAPTHEIDRLAHAVLANQLASGAFYPERATWSTARVCLGLAAAGLSIHTNQRLRSAIDWLLSPRERGGACDGGIWISGTGHWNSDLEVTAMVLLAALACGVDSDDERLRAGKKYLISQSDQWIVAGRELDGALAAHAHLEGGGSWDEIVGQVQRLSEWAQGEALWRTATLTSTESFEQSCRVAQTAWHLLAIGWSAIRADLPILLQALDAPEKHGLWRAATAFSEKSVLPKDQTPAVPATPTPVPATTQQRSTEFTDLISSLASLDSLKLQDLSVVGSYCRFDERVRNQLKDWRLRISANFAAKTCAHENFLIWAAPGSGKSFFVTETAASLPTVRFLQLNLAKQSQAEFCSLLDQLSASKEPTLTLVDEIDARSDEEWPYDVLFSHLDRNLSPDLNNVFVLVGSSRAGKNGMIQEMLLRKKGKDLLDRVPIDRRLEIPHMCREDRAVIFAANVIEAARARDQKVRYIEKLALFYLLVNNAFDSPRQLRDSAFSAVGRISSADDRMRYDNLFAVGDRENQRFWGDHQLAVDQLADFYVSI